MARAIFDGDVQPGKKYVLVDDVSTMGSTLAELANFVNSKGGLVAGTILLVDASRTGTMAPNPRTIRQLKSRYGNEIEQTFGIKPEALTASEAQYLIGFRSVDEFRTRAAKARDDRGQRLRTKGVREETADVERGDVYEPEHPNIQNRQRNPHRDIESQQGDLFASSALSSAPSSTAKYQYQDNFLQRYSQREITTVQSGFDVIISDAEAAHVFAPFRKHGAETMIAMPLDKNGKELGIIRHTKGTIDQSQFTAAQAA